MRIGSKHIILGGSLVISLSASAALAIEPGLDDVETYVHAKPRATQALPVAPKRARSIARPAKTIMIVAVGDTGLNAHMASVRPKGGYKHGDQIPWARASRDIEDEIDGDLNFMNLETIVTTDNGIRRENKTFNFRMHPNGAQHLVEIGFNLFSTANNHSMDFGARGARATLRHLDRLSDDGLLAWPGLGRDRETAGRPWPMEIKGERIMVSAIGITTGGFGHHRAGERRIGQMSYQSTRDFDEVTQRLSKALSSYKILSVHYGIERDVRSSRGEIAKLRGIASRAAGIDLVLGHHAHVARGVEINNGRVILYGLGNFLHHGTANMGGKGMCRDYGLMVKLHLKKMSDGRLQMRAIEALPLTNMHRQTRRMKPSKARKRVYVLNYLSRALDNSAAGSMGVRFTPQEDGSGLYCVDGSADDPGHIGALCAEWQPAVAASARLARQIANSCGGAGRSYASSDRKRKRKRKRSNKSGKSGKSKVKSKSGKSLYSQIFGD